ncbi:oxidoreductase, partial [Burkholderia multivorans]
AIARGDIELHAKQGKPIPPEWAIDAQGRPTTDPQAALQGAMRTFGGHKGSALAAMVELLGGALIGDLTSRESMDFDEGVGATP